MVAIDHVDNTIDQLSRISSTIASAVEQQGAASQEISSSISTAAKNSHEVTENAEALNELSHQNDEAAEFMSRSASDLETQVSNLSEQVDAFLESIRVQNLSGEKQAA